MKRKSFSKSVSLVLCTAMTVTMGGIPVLAETVDDAYEYAFTDADQPVIPDYGGAKAEDAAADTKSYADGENAGDIVSIPDSSENDLTEPQGTDAFFGEQSDWENFEYEGFASEDAVEVGEFFDDGSPVTQEEKQDAIYLDPQSGNDGSSGVSDTEAVKTLAHARELVNDGGTIYLLSLLETDGSYVLENVTLRPGKNSMNRLLRVKAGAELTLRNVKVYNNTPDNSRCAFSDNPILVYGTLQVEENTEIGPFPGKSCIDAQNGSTINLKSGKILGSGEESDRAVDSCGIYGYGATINMTGGLITGHVAKYGGGIAAYNNSVVTLTGGSITGNSSGQGAGVYLSDSRLIMKSGENGESCQITGNTAKADHDQYMYGEGGGIFLWASLAEITAGTISGNKAVEEDSDEGIYGGRGGAIVALYSQLTIDESAVLSDNIADSQGGAVFLEGRDASRSAALTVKGGTISNNKAGGSGGGIFAWCYEGNQAGTKVMVSGGKITGNYTGADADEENAMILMGSYADVPDENTGFANLYLSGSPEISGSVVFSDDTDYAGKGYGPVVYADSSLSVKTPVLIVPTYGTVGATAVVYENEAATEAYKQQFCSEKNGTRGLVKEGNTLKWIKKMKVELLTFTSFTPMKYTRKNVYIMPGETVDPADLPETALIPGYVKTGWRNQGADRTPWDPASEITTDMRVQEVWALVKPEVTVTADKERGCPSTDILLTAQTKHVLEDATFTYQWYKDGEILEGQTEETLTVSEAGEYKVVVIATSKAGAKASEENSVSIPAFEHSYTWQFDEKTHWQICSIGGEKTAAEAHVLGDWTVTKAAAISVAGEKERTCKTCGYKEKEAIPALPAPTATPAPTASPTPTAAPLTVKTDPYLTATAKKTSITLKWSKIAGADGYRVYGAKCGNSFKLVKTIKNGNAVKWTHKGLKSGTYYKYYVIGYKMIDGKRVTISRTVNIHMPTAGKGLGYAKTLKLNKKKVTIAKGKTAKIKATVAYTNNNLRKHVETVRYLSSNKKIATVNSKGVIKGKKKGTCTIYCYTQNGLCRKVKVKVK